MTHSSGVKVDFGKYYKYDELIGHAKTLVDSHPNLAELKCIGESYEKRKIWLVEITNKATGPAQEKEGPSGRKSG